MCQRQAVPLRVPSHLTLPDNVMEKQISAEDVVPLIAHDGAQVTDFLSDYFDQLDTPATRLKEAMRYGALNGGKRIRASLALCAARLVMPDDRKALQRAIAAAGALEMVHAYSLIHDDLPAMDDAELRRGKPSAHIAFDEATAILAGDALQTEAFCLLSNPVYGFAPAASVALVKELAIGSSVAGMAGGQMLDLQADELAKQGAGFDVAQTEQMQAMKTGALIIAGPVMGAIAAQNGQNDQAVITDLRHFASRLGVAFQVADDVLDVTADAEMMGKPVGRDKAQGKASFVDFYGLEGAKSYASELINSACDHLAKYDAQALPLQRIAHFIINRSY